MSSCFNCSLPPSYLSYIWLVIVFLISKLVYSRFKTKLQKAEIWFNFESFELTSNSRLCCYVWWYFHQARRRCRCRCRYHHFRPIHRPLTTRLNTGSSSQLFFILRVVHDKIKRRSVSSSMNLQPAIDRRHHRRSRLFSLLAKSAIFFFALLTMTSRVSSRMCM